TLSHHMRILCEAGLVDACKDGKWTHYSLSAQGSAEARAIIEAYTLSPDKVDGYKKCDCNQK
ncbi:MAG: ArsR/SmtB family transcription factor, partial [Candidatus Neoclostridium sp.]